MTGHIPLPLNDLRVTLRRHAQIRALSAASPLC